MPKKLTIEEMHRLAEEQGGKCLSDVYVNSEEKIKWECSCGNIWWTTPGCVKLGSWCPKCSIEKRSDTLRYSIFDMRKLAKSKGGKCVSEVYTNAHTKLKWECSCGNIWETTPNSIQQGRWCPKCANKNQGSYNKLNIEDMHKVAKSKGGKCLSDVYVNNSTKLWWECSCSNVWEAAPSSIKNGGSWCPICAGTKKKTIEDMQKLAEAKGGKCLSEEYKGARINIEWECSEGHKWEATPDNIKRGKWCFICSSDKLKSERICRAYFEQGFNKPFPKCRPIWLKNDKGNQMELDGYCEELCIAFEHQGRQHYEWIKHFHKTEAHFHQQQQHDEIKRKLCKEYNIILIEIPELYTMTPIEELKEHISKVLVKAGSITMLKDFKNTEIDLSKSFAPDNYLKKMQKLAEVKGGKCLSETYVNAKTKLKWKCSCGNIWKSVSGNIQQGRWCPVCAGVQKNTIEEMKELAESKGGKCLSEVYINAHTKLWWKCSEKHRWKASSNSIQQGQWCPECGYKKSANKRRGSIEGPCRLAEVKGGKCLSEVYVNAQTKLEWECSKGHKWKASSNSIQQGRWCPECGYKKGWETRRKKRRTKRIQLNTPKNK